MCVPILKTPLIDQLILDPASPRWQSEARRACCYIQREKDAYHSPAAMVVGTHNGGKRRLIFMFKLGDPFSKSLQVLSELGYTTEEIARLRQDRVI
jgi:hypothetical protein